MIGAYLADPKDWTGDPQRFVETTLERWAGTLGGKEIERTFGFTLRLTGSPGDDPDSLEIGDGVARRQKRLFLELWPNSGGHYGMKMGPTLDAMEKLHRGSTAMVWNRLTGALHRAGLEVWDHQWSIEQEEEMYAEWFDDMEAEADDPDDSPVPRPSKAVPRILRRKPVKRETVLRAAARAGGDGSWLGRLLTGAAEIEELAARIDHGWRDLTEEERNAYADAWRPWPSLVAWIRDGDAIQHLVDYEGDGRFNSGEPAQPACVWPFEPTTTSVLVLWEKLERCCRVLRKASELVQLLDSPEHAECLPLRITLGPAGG